MLKIHNEIVFQSNKKIAYCGNNRKGNVERFRLIIYRQNQASKEFCFTDNIKLQKTLFLCLSLLFDNNSL